MTAGPSIAALTADGILPVLPDLRVLLRDAVASAAVAGLLVHRRARRQGGGRALMLALEGTARDRGRTTLVLDTRDGDSSCRRYEALGYTRVGVVPQYARSADGMLHATAFYYKLLDG